MEIISFFPGLGLGVKKYNYAEKLAEKLAKKEGKFFLVCAEYSESKLLGLSEGLDIALSLDPEEAPILFCSFMHHYQFSENFSGKIKAKKFAELMARPRVRFVRLGETISAKDWYEEYQKALANEKNNF